MFGGLFGRSRTRNGGGARGAPDLNQSIQTLRTTIETLDKREAHLEKRIATCVAEAKKKSRAKDKRGALFELKKKRQLSKQLESIQGKKLNLETQIITLEGAHMNSLTLDAMRASAHAMQATVQEADLDKADEVMDEINEAMDKVEEMNDVTSQPIGPIYDEDELDAEYEALIDEEADELLTTMPSAPLRATGQTQPDVSVLPAVPTQEPATTTQAEDDELAALEAMVA